MQQLNRK